MPQRGGDQREPPQCVQPLAAWPGLQRSTRPRALGLCAGRGHAHPVRMPANVVCLYLSVRIFGGINLYTTGVTRRLSKVLLISPPMSTIARGEISGLVL